MFGCPKESLRELIRSQQEESRRYQEKRDEESKKQAKKRDEEAKKRDEESRRYQAKRDEEFRIHQAELHRLRIAAEAREEETREFNREILLRNEKVYTTVIAEMEEGRKQLEEGRKQIQANTKAVLSVLDRLEGSGGMAA